MLDITNEKVIEKVTEAFHTGDKVLGTLSNWLDPQGNKGWHTCLVTGKKIRGQKAKTILHQQEDLMDYVNELIEQDQAEQMKADEFLESEETEEQIEAENQAEELQILQEIDPNKITERLVTHIETTGRPMKTVTIECVDCGGERVIKIQDKFQVKRCVSCQKKHRNRRRAARRREKKAEEKELQEQQETTDKKE